MKGKKSSGRKHNDGDDGACLGEVQQGLAVLVSFLLWCKKGGVF